MTAFLLTRHREYKVRLHASVNIMLRIVKSSEL